LPFTPAQQAPAKRPKASPEGQTEVESRSGHPPQYGSAFLMLKTRIGGLATKSSRRSIGLRAFPTDNGTVRAFT